MVESISENAFKTSPYPVILSIENHCSLGQQSKMAQIFINTFGEKLVTKFLFESDYSDEPRLPSPNQLKYRILIKNKKLRGSAPSALLIRGVRPPLSKSTPGKSPKLVGTAMAISLNEDDYDDEDDDDDDDDISLDDGSTNVQSRGADINQSDDISSINQSESITPENTSPVPSDSSGKTQSDSTAPHPRLVHKNSLNIAPELSDLVVYCQAVKFRGFLSYPLSPITSTVSASQPSRKLSTRKANASISSGSSTVSQSSAPTISVSEKTNSEVTAPSSSASSGIGSLGGSSPASGSPPAAISSAHKRPQMSAPCYQVSSLNEFAAKKLCRKSPLAVINHTVTQIMRTYPSRMRIDSSNFNPVIFWAFGLQSSALNYQTVDTALHINTAMYEQNGNCGYVPKPSAMTNKSHLMFGRFNPWDKEFDGLHVINLMITVSCRISTSVCFLRDVA